MSLEQVYRRSDRMVGRRVADEFVLVPLARRGADLDAIYNLSRVGAYIWERLDGRASGESIVTELVAEFEVDRRGGRARLPGVRGGAGGAGRRGAASRLIRGRGDAAVESGTGQPRDKERCPWARQSGTAAVRTPAGVVPAPVRPLEHEGRRRALWDPAVERGEVLGTVVEVEGRPLISRPALSGLRSLAGSLRVSVASFSAPEAPGIMGRPLVERSD